MLRFLHYLQSLQYESVPNYDYIDQLFTEMFEYSDGKQDAPYDWDIPERILGMPQSTSQTFVDEGPERIRHKNKADLAQAAEPLEKDQFGHHFTYQEDECMKPKAKAVFRITEPRYLLLLMIRPPVSAPPQTGFNFRYPKRTSRIKPSQPVECE
jgi:hypothetical protein